MSPRVNKVVGYGLADVKLHDGEIVDDRINADSLLLAGPQPGLRDFVAFARKRHAEAPGARQFESELAIATADKVGDTPPSLRHSAQRRGRRHRHPCAAPPRRHRLAPPRRHHRLPRDRRHGDHHPPAAWWHPPVRGPVDERGDRPWSPPRRGRPPARHSAWLLQPGAGGRRWGGTDLGFTDLADAAANLAPAVPDPIVELAEFGELFTSPRAMRTMRPMIATFWR